VLGGVLLFAMLRSFPPALSDLRRQFNPALAARVLYGGITEEVLLRWGFMTALVWLAWRVLQGRRGPVRSAFVWLAIVTSALVFGLGHLPIVYALAGGTVSATSVVIVVGANAVFGVLFGYLFWRWGLESAMIAHATAHVVAEVVSRAAGAQ
jgi:hypothetical protein